MFNRSSSTHEDAGERTAEPLFNARAMAQGAPRDRGASRPAAAAQPSSIGESLRLEGHLSGEAELQLDGHVKGDIRVTRVVIGASACVEGAVRAQQVDVLGRVQGSIEAQTVRLHASAHVEGDIRHGHLAIEGGAYFEGRCQPLNKAAQASPAAVVPAGPKVAAGVTPFPAAAEPRDGHARPAGVTAV